MWARLVSLSLLLTATSCGTTLPWTGTTDPAAPGGLALLWTASTAAAISWDDQPGVDGWEAAMRVGDGPWNDPTFVAALVPARTETSFYFTVPELTRLYFGVRAVAGSHRSSWSELAYDVGVQAPAMLSMTPHSGYLTLHWTNQSAVATDVRVERIPASDSSASWTDVPGASLSAGSVDDHDVTPGVLYHYRVRVGTGGVWSDALTTFAIGI